MKNATFNFKVVSETVFILYAHSAEPCITKIFESPVTNKALMNHVISTPTVTSTEVCEIECFLEIRCESYNFGPKKGGGHVCELSDSDARRDPLDWTTKHGFIYRGTKVGKVNRSVDIYKAAYFRRSDTNLSKLQFSICVVATVVPPFESAPILLHSLFKVPQGDQHFICLASPSAYKLLAV